MKRIQYVLMLAVLFITCNAYGQLWKQYADSAKAYTDKKNISKAIEFNNSAREELKKDSSITNSYAMICYDLARSFYNTRRYNEAEPLYLEAKQIWENLFGKEHKNYANCCNNLAQLYNSIRESEKAIALATEAMQIRGKIQGKGSADYGVSCMALAHAYSDIGQFGKAELLYLEAKQVFEKSVGKTDFNYGVCCFNLAYSYSATGQYEKAEFYFTEYRQIRTSLLVKADQAYANSSNLLAAVYYNMGLYEKAEVLYLEARQILQEVLGKENLNYFDVGSNLALLYLKMGQYEKAETLYMDSRQMREKVFGKNHPEYAIISSSLAGLYQNMGHLEKAESLEMEARQIREKAFGKNHPDYAISCVNLAIIYKLKGQHVQAEPLLIEGKEILEKIFGKEHPHYAGSCLNLAVHYLDIGQYKKAEPLFLEAKLLKEKQVGNQHLDYGKICSAMANLYWLLGQPFLAEKEFKESFSAKVHNLISVFQFSNEKEKTQFIKNVSGQDDIAYSFYLSEKVASAQPYSLSLFHRNLILSSLQFLNQYIFSGYDTLINNMYTEWVNIKKYLSVLYSSPKGMGQANRVKLEEQAGHLEREINRRSSFFKNYQDDQAVTWENIQQNLKVGEAAIEFTEFRFHNGKRYTDSTYYIASLLRKDQLTPEMVYLFEKRQLDSLLRYKSTSAGQHQLSYLYTKGRTEANKSLYDIIWKPVDEKLAGIKTIYFAPAGALHKIAFSALPVSTTQVLSDKYQLVQLNTTASVGDKSLSSLKASDKIILYGGVQYDADSTSIRQAALNYSANDVASRSLPDDLLREGVSDFYYLTGTEKEVTAIENLARKSNYTITRSYAMLATEESFKNLTGKNSPSVLHVATHGFFFPDPKNEKKDDRMGGSILFKQSDNPLIRSGLALAGANNAWKGKPVSGVEDGILTAYEISNMYLPNTKLAVLSACETGLGDIQGSEGVYGLQRAFKMAGVQNLVMSLWKVPDIETAEFMEEFYKNLFDKQTISIAFLNAQSVMKNKYRNDPYKWAAWVLVR